ncbi:MAG: hypothetical protein ABIJ09_07855 [Pseudomonadota bacterium]
MALLVAILLVGIYNANPSYLQGNDGRGSILGAVSLAMRGDVELHEFEALYSYARGDLAYYVLATERGEHIPRFNFGVPLVSAPFFWLALRLQGGSISEISANFLGKWISSLAVALAAVLVLLTALRLGAARWQALAAALLYGLGTCAFSTVSQMLWQHGPAEFFCMLGIYLLLRDGKLATPLSGAAFAMMVVCRPVLVMFAIAALIHVARQQRCHLPGFVLSALPLAVLQAGYNWYYLGAPWIFSQSLTIPGADSLQRDYWDTPPWQGFLGLLVSPSRGLFIYSPFFLFLFWRPVQNWRETPTIVRAMLLASVLLVLLHSSYYGWYGGWTFGYRMVVDATPILCLALLPVLARLRHSGTAALTFVITGALALMIHTVGAYCYNVVDWDGRPDIDFHLQRLWSVQDSQLVYWFQHLELRQVVLHPEQPAGAPQTLSGLFNERAELPSGL